MNTAKYSGPYCTVLLVHFPIFCPVIGGVVNNKQLHYWARDTHYIDQWWMVVLVAVKYAKATCHGIQIHPRDHNQKLNASLSHTHGIYTSHQRHHTPMWSLLCTHGDHYHTLCGIITAHPWDHYKPPLGSLPHTHGINSMHPWNHYHAPIGSLPVVNCCTVDKNTLRPHVMGPQCTPGDHNKKLNASLSHNHGIITTHPWDQYHKP